MVDLSANANTRWASLFIDELAKAGMRDICFAPGSRSTPLTLAAGANASIRLHRHLDERSAGFFALGLARASGRPAALIGTSGTAVANFFPAVIEAYQAHVPLLVLSADRPPELRQSGANQTIDQLKLFGDQVRLFLEMPVPHDAAPDVVERHWLTAAARAYATASGPPAGPVHVNFPFRKPLEPPAIATLPTTSANDAGSASFTNMLRGNLTPSQEMVETLTELIRNERQGLIVCGPNCPGGDFVRSVIELAHLAGYPVVADPLSGLRYGPHVQDCKVIGGYDVLLQGRPEAWPEARVILRFGDVPTSAALNAYIEHCAPEHLIHVRQEGVWADDLHLVRHFWQADEAALCRAVSDGVRQTSLNRDRHWADQFESLEESAWQSVEAFTAQAPFFDGAIVLAMLAGLPDNVTLFVGNSLPIRHADALGQPAPRPLRLFGNRGASGIDGNVSTALGLAVATGQPSVALLGDITFYHDMNGLLALRQMARPPVTFVVLNNDGGAIFRRLPVSALDPPFTELFLTPHGLSFRETAALYGLAYHRIADSVGLNWLQDHLSGLHSPNGSAAPFTLVEAITDGANDLAQHRALVRAVAQATVVPTPS